MAKRAAERVIVFTRYPQPGCSKTRLISQLGPEGAAQLHRQLTEGTLTQLRLACHDRGAQGYVYYTGASEASFAHWLGRDQALCKQEGADLGDRLRDAFDTGFGEEASRVVIIGTDCPSLDAGVIGQALDQLKDHDVVIGPAFDGGYYLIALRRSLPELFVDIPWGTEGVLARTRAALNQMDASVAYLEPRADIDRPEDLIHLGVRA